MSESLPTVDLARHGETAWTAWQYTGLTDLPSVEGAPPGSFAECLKGLTFATPADRTLIAPRKRILR